MPYCEMLSNSDRLRSFPGYRIFLFLTGSFKFSTSIPIIGNQLSGLTLLMGITMVIQSALTTTDPAPEENGIHHADHVHILI